MIFCPRLRQLYYKNPSPSLLLGITFPSFRYTRPRSSLSLSRARGRRFTELSTGHNTLLSNIIILYYNIVMPYSNRKSCPTVFFFVSVHKYTVLLHTLKLISFFHVSPLRLKASSRPVIIHWYAFALLPRMDTLR